MTKAYGERFTQSEYLFGDLICRLDSVLFSWFFFFFFGSCQFARWISESQIVFFVPKVPVLLASLL